nr:hypothetical protein [Tanacetum cinerariifolium]
MLFKLKPFTVGLNRPCLIGRFETTIEDIFHSQMIWTRYIYLGPSTAFSSRICESRHRRLGYTRWKLRQSYEAPKLQKFQNYGNQAKGIEAHGMVHALGGGETNQDLNNIEDDINA